MRQKVSGLYNIRNKSNSRKNQWESIWSSPHHRLLRKRSVNTDLCHHVTRSSGISEAYSELCQTSKMVTFAKIVKQLTAVDYYCKTLHIRCFTGFWICPSIFHSCLFQYRTHCPLWNIKEMKQNLFIFSRDATLKKLWIQICSIQKDTQVLTGKYEKLIYFVLTSFIFSS